MKQNEFNVSWLSGMPRSGTTWVSQMLASSPEVRLKSCPLFSFEFKNQLDLNSLAGDWYQLFNDVYNTESEFLDQEHLRKKGLIPSFTDKCDSPSQLVIKSNRFHHLIPDILHKHREIKFIYLVRHPCAVLYSWISDPNEFPQNENYRLHWRSGACRKTGVGEFWGFDDWVKVTTQALLLSQSYPNRFKIFRYEDFINNTIRTVQDMYEYLDLPVTSNTKKFIDISQTQHNDHKHSVFKRHTLIPKWQNFLDKDIAMDCIEAVKGTALEQFMS